MHSKPRAFSRRSRTDTNDITVNPIAVEKTIKLWCDEQRCVYIDFSEYVGFECTTTLTPWNQKVCWYTCSDAPDIISDESVVQDDPGFYFSLLVNSPETNPWWDAIPVDVRKAVLTFERTFSGVTFLLLRCISSSKHALELFLSDQLLMALILYAARDQKWTVQRAIDCTALKRKDILRLCGMQGSQRVLNILKKLQFDNFSEKDYRCLAGFIWPTKVTFLSHLQYIDMPLLHFIRDNPGYADARFLVHYSRQWDWREVRMLLKDTTSMALRLDLEVDQDINLCANTHTLRLLHDRMVKVLNQLAIDDLPFITFPEPPLLGNDDIIPITNNKQLHHEGANLHHCVATYEVGVLRGDYYVYSVMAPERATLGVRISEDGSVRIDQLKKTHNQKPSQDMVDSVRAWLLVASKNRISNEV